MNRKKKLAKWYSPAQIKAYAVRLDHATMSSEDGAIVRLDTGTAIAILEVLEQARQLSAKVDHEIPDEMRKPTNTRNKNRKHVRAAERAAIKAGN